MRQQLFPNHLQEVTPMNKNDLAFYNDYFSKLEKFEIKKLFRYNKDEK